MLMTFCVEYGSTFLCASVVKLVFFFSTITTTKSMVSRSLLMLLVLLLHRVAHFVNELGRCRRHHFMGGACLLFAAFISSGGLYFLPLFALSLACLCMCMRGSEWAVSDYKN